MKTSRICAGLLGMLVWAAAPARSAPAARGGTADTPRPAAAKSTDARKTRLRFQNITCSSCASRVMHALRRVPGVRAMTVNVRSREGVVLYKPGTCRTTDLLAAARKAGFPAAELR